MPGAQIPGPEFSAVEYRDKKPRGSRDDALRGSEKPVKLALIGSGGGEPTLTLAEDAEPDTLPLPKPEVPITCRHCGHQITTSKEAASIDGVHERTFRNPAGYSFHVLCYHRAPGCREASGPVKQDSWFPGTSWSIAVCGECQQHLGWYYAARDDTNFYGLIATRLVLPK